MKKLYIISVLVLGVFILGYILSAQREEYREKVYVALEGEGTIVALDAADRTVVSTIDLAEEKNGTRVQFMPHNVQTAPDNKTVWVAANAMKEEKKQALAPFIKVARADEGHSYMATDEYDEVIVIDPLTDTIIKRIPIAVGSGLAHVVVSPDSRTAYVTLQSKGEIYKIDAVSSIATPFVSFGEGSGPHGFRISPDGSKIFVAEVAGKAFAVVNVADGAVKTYSTGSGVVQTAVTVDGKYAFGSLYSTKGILRYEIATQKIDTIALPKEAKGPVQIYPTPDSRFLYVADQGYYFDQPTSNVVYRIDIEKGAVDQAILAGSAPHGVAIDDKGVFVYVTNLLSNDLSVIDVASGKEVARISVGKTPNGVSVWSNTPGSKAPPRTLSVPATEKGNTGVLVATEKFYDLGTISMAAGKVTHTFVVKNTGVTPAVIERIFTSCMCTTASLITGEGKVGPFSMAGHAPIHDINKAIAPGEEAGIEVTVDPAAHGPSGTGKARKVVYVKLDGVAEPVEFLLEVNVTK